MGPVPAGSASMHKTQDRPRDRADGPHVFEFVAMMAGLMALNALAIDVMLPALDEIGRALGAADDNATQLVVVVYVLGFGFPQLAVGPLTDRFGRRPVLFVSLIGYVLTGLGCMAAHSFEALLVWRFLQGVFASGSRVIAASVVRDLYAGRNMARIMSLVMTVFMVVPILAPGLGQLVMMLAPWEAVFGVLVAGGMVMLAWTYARLPETLPAERRTPLSGRGVWRAYRTVFTTPVTLGYMLGSGVIFGALFSFIASSPQVFGQVFGLQDTFVLWFAGIALMLSLANFTNSRLVEAIGMRRLSHIALTGFTVLSLVLLAAMSVFGERFEIFYPLFAAIFACFGLIGANFSALAMEPLGRIAGTGSAVYGFFTTTLSGVIGGWVGSLFAGSTLPLIAGYAGLGLITLSLVLITEKGRLFATR